ncbi:hypothetical protein G5I_07968 [Acromyrmex echinatior]|uniref:Uncharacterized protein n=1 Tax=Acromyrmex echinatior TaxID=103372 RepID=F4WQ84_ACREC|nr:hypothetical protein G5I_07968 [Acromyrmex echinatior]
MVVGSEFLEVGRMAESTKGVEENDKGIEGKRGDIGARGETRNGGRKREEEEGEGKVKEEKKEEEEDEKEVGEERAIKGKSQATCTRQQPPTSEELIINLLSPSPNATVLTRPPSLHFHLNVKVRTHKEAAKRCVEQRCGGCFWNRYRDAKHDSRVRKSSNDPDVQIHKHMPARVYVDARVTKQGMRCETYDSRSSLNGYSIIDRDIACRI